MFVCKNGFSEKQKKQNYNAKRMEDVNVKKA